MQHAQIRRIAFYLPSQQLHNEELAKVFTAWTEEKIVRKLGIESRPVTASDETSVDMAVNAAEALFQVSGCCEPDEIDYVLLCTQSPDYFLPTSACLVHERLGLPKSCGALDFNLGCSGFVYGLSLCKGLIEGGMAKNILLITSETYTKFINPLDRVTRPLFGDGAAATLVSAVESATPSIGPFVFGTDGAGANLLIVPAGGLRTPRSTETAVEIHDAQGSVRSKDQLFMHGPGIFSFAIDRVPPMVEELLHKSGKNRDDIDCYVFHQANKYMLTKLRELCNIDESRYFNDVLHRGNTVSSSIPIGMIDACNTGMLKPGHLAMLVGFGVGLSWAGTLVTIPDDFVTT